MRILVAAAVLGVCGVALLACKELNPAFCGAHPEDPRCSGDAAPTDMTPDLNCIEQQGCAAAGLGVCETTTQSCVQCIAPDQVAACQGATPVCRGDHTCAACTIDSDCPSNVCLASGACAAEVDVAFVSEGGTDNEYCSKVAPCATLHKALAAKNAAAGPRPYVKVAGSISDNAAIDHDVTVLADTGAELKAKDPGAVLSITGTSVVVIKHLTISGSKSAADAGVLAIDTSTVTLDHVTVAGNAGNGVSCAGKALVVVVSTIAQNKGFGVGCSARRVTVSSSTILKNEAGGISLTAASFDITNNFIVHNGTPGSGATGSLVGGVGLPAEAIASGSRFAFNTVADNHARVSSALAGGVLCDLEGFAAPNNIIARNDLNGGTAPSNANTFGFCSFPTSFVMADVTTLKFVAADADPGNYHITAGSVAIDQATTATTVTTDFDGQARAAPAIADQGADEYRGN